MKLFQQLLVAPAALGLLAPVAANAAELNINGVSDYAATSEQVTSIAQFSDVYPTDWAYQALSNLVERYGCVAGYPNGTYRGNRAMTRYEAAALLNACLDRVTEVTDELKRLMREFDRELAMLKGRVNGLEARVGEMEASFFSTTTKLKGKTTFIMGAVTAGGDETTSDAFNQEEGAFTFSYDQRLTFVTSFTGKDKLTTRLRTGNMKNNVFSGKSTSFNLTGLDTASDKADNEVFIDRLGYKFPVGKEFMVFVGPLARNTESLAMWPSKYNKGGVKVLDFFSVAGVPAIYNKETGTLIGGYWKQKVAKGDPAFSISANYVADDGEGNNSNSATDGFLTDGSKGNFLAQLGWGNGQSGAAVAYRYGQCDSGIRRATEFVGSTAVSCSSTAGESRYSNGVALNVYWQPEEVGFIPSISAGWALNVVSGDNLAMGTITETQSWFTGLKWDDVFVKGNALGFAFGQPTFATALKGGDTPSDGNYAFEAYYNFRATDNITITPALFYLSRPKGQLTNALVDDSFNVFGGVVQTTFKF